MSEGPSCSASKTVRACGTMLASWNTTCSAGSRCVIPTSWCPSGCARSRRSRTGPGGSTCPRGSSRKSRGSSPSPRSPPPPRPLALPGSGAPTAPRSGAPRASSAGHPLPAAPRASLAPRRLALRRAAVHRPGAAGGDGAPAARVSLRAAGCGSAPRRAAHRKHPRPGAPAAGSPGRPAATGAAPGGCQQG